MSQIDFSNAPVGATHYLSAERAEDVAWFRLAASICRWFPLDGKWAPIGLLPPMSQAIPAIPATAKPDWSTAPEGATHWGPEAPGEISTTVWPVSWYKDIHGERAMYATAMYDWDWREMIGLPERRRAMLIARPVVVAEPAPFSPDWATAPDDATHHSSQQSNEPWRKVLGDKIFMWFRGEWVKIGGAECGSYVLRPAADFVPRDFGGEVKATSAKKGLPPIGSTRLLSGHTEYLTVTHPEWEGREVKIHAHFVTDRGIELAAYVSADHMIGGVGFAGLFLPTPEQVASDKRLHAVRNACTDIAEALKALHESQEHTAVVVVEAMIDAGYRKPVEVSQ